LHNGRGKLKHSQPAASEQTSDSRWKYPASRVDTLPTVLGLEPFGGIVSPHEIKRATVVACSPKYLACVQDQGYVRAKLRIEVSPICPEVYPFVEVYKTWECDTKCCGNAVRHDHVPGRS